MAHIEEIQQDSIMSTDGLTKNKNLIKAGPLSIDPGCISCSSKPAHTVQMFKMACISYNPSKIEYRKHSLDR